MISKPEGLLDERVRMTPEALSEKPYASLIVSARGCRGVAEALAYIDQPRTITAVRDSIGDDNCNDAEILSGCGRISMVGQDSERPKADNIHIAT